MSQHKTGSAGGTSQMFKKTELTWKVKDKATSQLARSDARLTVSGLNQIEGTGRDCPPKSFYWGTEVLTPPKGGSVPGKIFTS